MNCLVVSPTYTILLTVLLAEMQGKNRVSGACYSIAPRIPPALERRKVDMGDSW